MEWFAFACFTIGSSLILYAMILILKGRINNRIVRIYAVNQYVVRSYSESTGLLHKRLRVLIVSSTVLFILLSWTALINLFTGTNNLFFWSLAGMIVILCFQPLVAWILNKNNGK
ncbi:hypothetical protein VXN63_00545 [Marinilactibacillus sp. XAAS-LB27]|uniref:hypothetical protein n=1 Tax=Marinilactibacillus sp. XAAS-LB27 TaxID=3114538 RepID=UPI002E187168|nr:hypothetical protein [Marinilactibacillus sp. XAAS-LB27]